MLNTRTVVLASALFLSAFPARSGPLVYVVAGGITGNGTFATMDLTTGTFTPLGPPEPDGYDGLATGPNGSLYSLTYAANIDSIDPKTGNHTNVGATGLGACLIPSPACGPNSGLLVGGIGGKLYATDFSNNFYSVSPSTGAAKLIGATGIAPFPYVVGSQNPDGSTNVGDVALFGAGGKLYYIFDAFVINLNTDTVEKVVISPKLYQVDPATAHATPVASIPLGFAAAVDVNGTVYAFNENDSAIETLNLTTGATSLVSHFDPSDGLILGAAAPAPEPTSWALALLGTVGLGFAAEKRKRRSCPR